MSARDSMCWKLVEKSEYSYSQKPKTNVSTTCYPTPYFTFASAIQIT